MPETSSKQAPLYIIGGRLRPKALQYDQWERHECAVILEVWPATGRVETRVQHVCSPEVLAIPNSTFGCSTLEDGVLYVTTPTEVIAYRVPGFERVGYLSLPQFNDVHHVRPTTRGTWLIANTGLDLVLETTPQGEVLREWDVLGREPWSHFDRDTDYRHVPSTKPHASHPNFVYELDDEIWVTRFEQQDTVRLEPPTDDTDGSAPSRVKIGPERIHDGVLAGDRIYFTTVDGCVVIVDAKRHEVVARHDLNPMTDTDLALGWCRGIVVLDERRVIVGFSRIRPTRIHANLRWLKHRAGRRATAGVLATRFACYDLEAGCLEWEFETEQHGLGAIFSMHRVPALGSTAEGAR